MKNLFILIFVAALLGAACNEKKSTNTESGTKGENWKNRYGQIYENAIELGDANTAIMALHELIVRDSVTLHYYDSLARLYFDAGRFDAALVSADRVLAQQPDNNKLLEIAAEADQFMGNSVRATNRFKMLYERTNKPRYLYRVAADYFATDNFEAGKATVDSIINHPMLKQDTIQLFYGQGQGQRVPMEAAVYNLQGYLLAREGKIDQALKNYRKALEVAPDFYLAQRNIQEITKRQ